MKKTSKFFRDAEAELKKSPAARDKSNLTWFRSKIKELYKKATPHNIMRGGDKLSVMPAVGSMYFYFYDPKLKHVLPYFDRFPLTIVIKHYKDGFLGLNLHYLPYAARISLLTALDDITNNKKYDETTKMKVSYELLKNSTKYAAYAPCLKRYLYKQMRSRVLKVHPEDWVPAAYLPVARFEGKKATSVWKESMIAVNGDM